MSEHTQPHNEQADGSQPANTPPGQQTTPPAETPSRQPDPGSLMLNEMQRALTAMKQQQYGDAKEKAKPQPRVTIRKALETMFEFRIDVGSGKRFQAPAGTKNPFDFKGFTVTSDFINGICLSLAEMKAPSTRATVVEVICSPQVSKPINMVAEQLHYLDSQYDGKDYVGELVACLKTDDNDLVAQLLPKWLVSTVAQVMDLTRRNEYAFVFVGEQGNGKTGFWERLLWPISGQVRNPYFAAPATAFNFTNKEHMLLLSTHMLILLDEMSAYSKKTDLDQLKAAFSLSLITTDKKFQEAETYPRIGSFCGTTNRWDFLRDDSGDRRFIVFELLEYDQERYNAIDKMQLWGQLVRLYKAGFTTRLTQTEIRQNIQRNLSQFSMEKVEEYFIEEYFEITKDKNDFVPNKVLFECEEKFNLALSSKRFGLSRTSIVAKLRLAGVKCNHAGRVDGKVVKGYQGLKLRHDTHSWLLADKDTAAEGIQVIQEMAKKPEPLFEPEPEVAPRQQTPEEVEAIIAHNKATYRRVAAERNAVQLQNYAAWVAQGRPDDGQEFYHYDEDGKQGPYVELPEDESAMPDVSDILTPNE